MPSSIEVIGFPTGVLGANCYLLINRSTGACVIVDPGAQPEVIIDHCRSLTPAAVLLTHAHFDHFGAAEAVCDHFGIPLYVHKADIPALSDAVINASVSFGMSVQARLQPIPLEGGETLRVAGLDIAVLHTPGHTPGGVCYLLPDNSGILTGDTVMAHGYGRTDLAGGDTRAMMRSLHMLLHITPRMTMYPGHDEMGIIGRDV